MGRRERPTHLWAILPSSSNVTVRAFDDSDTIVASADGWVTDGVAGASLPTAGIPVGTYTVTAEYHGTPPFAGSTSDPVSLEVVKIPRSLSLAGGPATGTVVVPGGGIRLKADVDFGMGGYTIDFYETTGGAHDLLGSGVASGGFYPFTPPQASIDLAGRDAGVYTFSAEWPGNAAETSAVDSVTVTVERAATTISLDITPTSVEQNHQATLTWAITRPASSFEASGSVTIRDETTDAILGTGNHGGKLPSVSWRSEATRLARRTMATTITLALQLRRR